MHKAILHWTQDPRTFEYMYLSDWDDDESDCEDIEFNELIFLRTKHGELQRKKSNS